MESLYGVYTAGTQVTPAAAYNQPRVRSAVGTVLTNGAFLYEGLVDGGTDSVYSAWYPDHGGNLTLAVGGDLTGDIATKTISGYSRPDTGDLGYDTAAVGDWLWRQGSGGTAVNGSVVPTAWWINFGTYAASQDGRSTSDVMIGFTGFGTLGGGNLNAQVAGNAGTLTTMMGAEFNSSDTNQRTQGLVLAVGSTGQVAADGSIAMTGGGDLTLKVGGALNPVNVVSPSGIPDHLNGLVTDLRGHAAIQAASVGTIQLSYMYQAPDDTRASNPFQATRALVNGGISLAPGDATFSVATAGDLVVQQVDDPGRVPATNAAIIVADDGYDEPAFMTAPTWFTLWTKQTAIDMFSAGGNVTPITQGQQTTDNGYVYPSIVRVVAASGSLFYGGSATRDLWTAAPTNSALVLAPSDTGELQFLAQDSIFAGGMSVSQSGADPASLATPQHAAYYGSDQLWGVASVGNLSGTGNPPPDGTYGDPLFAFGPDTAAGAQFASAEPARFYAVDGDIIGVSSGRTMTFYDDTPPPFYNRRGPRYGQTWYEGSPVWMIAGRDIVRSGNLLGSVISSGPNNYEYHTATTNLFVQSRPDDISIVSAGRDILYSSFTVAGPGTLQITAGRNIEMDDKASVTSIGPVVPGDTRSGASIAMLAGVGSAGPDDSEFAALYLDPANLLPVGTPLDGSGKVAKTYENELVAWLEQRTGFSGSVAEARAAFAALPPEQQSIFLRQVYFAELRAGGREYNDAGSSRYGSYLRGREAIAALFPTTDAAGKPIVRSGDITMFGGAGVRTNFGGDIQMMAPSGRILIGVEGVAPPSTAGVLTQGSGDIGIYSQGSILLGLSRIVTTFGGSVLAWSAEGDINAGRGAKTTVLYTPPRRVYDNYGNVKLSPQTPSAGAGIATLNPIPEVPVGNVDLIAPLGTIDAGEAGIRVSGSLNVAALHVANAANIQVQGKSTGVPVTASVNTGALTAASSAASAATQMAQNLARNNASGVGQRRWTITVEVQGFGDSGIGGGTDSTRKRKPTPVSYNPSSEVSILGFGGVGDTQRTYLTKKEQSKLGEGI